MKISVIGTGYVGLVTGTCLAKAGHDVVCVDIDEAKVARMLNGEIPIYEPGLEEIFKQVLQDQRIHITTDLAAGIKDATVIFLALPTPPGADGSADLSAVMNVANQLGPLLAHYTVIVDKSTVPVGTGEQVGAEIAEGTAQAFDVVSNPEFLREGLAVEDFLHPDRIIIGTDSEKARNVMRDVYESFYDDPAQFVCMDIRSAEMTKYAANSFLAMKVSFMNEMANLCELVDADVDSIRLGIGPDQRIGSRFLFAGIGFGGSCFPKDAQALLRTADSYGYDFRLLEGLIKVNKAQKRRLLEKMKFYYGETTDWSQKHFAIWGLAFKPDTDDIREAPALEMIDGLLDLGATVTVYDPQAMANTKKHFGENDRITYADNAISATTNADALLIITEWDEFRSPDFEKLKSELKTPVIFDGRNMHKPDQMKQRGFYYSSIGRPTATL